TRPDQAHELAGLDAQRHAVEYHLWPVRAGDAVELQLRGIAWRAGATQGGRLVARPWASPSTPIEKLEKLPAEQAQDNPEARNADDREQAEALYEIGWQLDRVRVWWHETVQEQRVDRVDGPDRDRQASAAEAAAEQPVRPGSDERPAHREHPEQQEERLTVCNRLGLADAWRIGRIFQEGEDSDQPAGGDRRQQHVPRQAGVAEAGLDQRVGRPENQTDEHAVERPADEQPCTLHLAR